jgi:hypothetical protein
MPRPLPAGVAQEAQMRGGVLPIVLVDVVTYNGATYYWSDVPGTYPSRIGGGNQAYIARVKSAGPFRLFRSVRSDAGNLVIENVSGPGAQRNAAAAVASDEFEGAMCIVRYWSYRLQVVEYEFDGFLSEQPTDDDELQFRVLQLLDGSMIDVPENIYSENCTLKGARQDCNDAGVRRDFGAQVALTFLGTDRGYQVFFGETLGDDGEIAGGC